MKDLSGTFSITKTIILISSRHLIMKLKENSTGLYEIRVEVGNNIFRVFSFFDKNQLVILINGFQKKSQKTPRKEIELAEKLKKQYFDEKDKK